MRTSISTTSGRSRRTSSSACAPSAASPTTVISPSLSRIRRKPVRTSSWSSASATRIMSTPPAGRRAAPTLPAAAHLDLTAVHRPVPDPDEPVASAATAIASTAIATAEHRRLRPRARAPYPCTEAPPHAPEAADRGRRQRARPALDGGLDDDPQPDRRRARRALEPGCGANGSTAPRSRRTPSRMRISSTVSRPVRSTLARASLAASGSLARMRDAAVAWIVITLTLCATTSWSSCAMRMRSASTAARARASRSAASSAASSSSCSARRRQDRMSPPDDPRHREPERHRKELEAVVVLPRSARSSPSNHGGYFECDDRPDRPRESRGTPLLRRRARRARRSPRTTPGAARSAGCCRTRPRTRRRLRQSDTAA